MKKQLPPVALSREIYNTLFGINFSDFNIFLFLVPHHVVYGELVNRANFPLPVFDGFTCLGVWRIQKIQN